MVLPEPTSPYMYMPFGRSADIGGSADEAGFEDEKKEKNDFLGGCRDAMVGCSTVGCVQFASMLCRSSRFLMIPDIHQLAAMPSIPGLVPLWWSSSLNRPDSTRASYSAMGPWDLSMSWVETIRVSN